EKDLGIHFIDVGYGDAVFIKTRRINILVDTGDRERGRKTADYLKSFKVKKIDMLFLTHPHPDHIGGFRDISKEIKIGRIFSERPLGSVKEYTEIYNYVLEEKLSARVLKRGDIITQKGITVKVLNPGVPNDELNDSCLVLKIETNGMSALLTGDIGSKQCSRLAEIYGEGLESRILKVPHHGKAGKKDFIDKVGPEIAVITTGPSKWGGPDKDITDVYKKSSISILRTDKNGDITVIPSAAAR
nr:MBL fold metallo-hydrolase [Elusimicrobiota bacterium]